MSLIDYQGLWESYQTEFKLAANYKLMEFGNTVEMAQELAELVLKGEKTATSALLAYYEVRSETPSQVGDCYFLLGGSKSPVALIEITKVNQIKFGEVDEVFAKAEGDGQLSNWLSIHRPYYTAQLKAINQELKPDTLLEATYFKVLKRI